MDSTQEVNGDTASNPCRVTKKTSRSYRASILQTFLKSFASTLVKPGKPTDKGSPELFPDEEAFKRCNIRQRVVEGVRLYDLNARAISTAENFIPALISSLKVENEPVKVSEKSELEVINQMKTHEEQNITSHDFAAAKGSPRGKRRKQIYYFCGGGWRNKPSGDHWKLCAHLAYRLTARGFPTTVTIVSYPLAPNNPFSTSFPMLENLYNEILPPFEEFESDTATTTTAIPPTSAITSPSTPIKYESPQSTNTSLIDVADKLNLNGGASGSNLGSEFWRDYEAKDYAQPDQQAPQSFSTSDPAVNQTAATPRTTYAAVSPADQRPPSTPVSTLR